MHKPYTTEDFINVARSIHGDKYDYSSVNYINSITKVSITCPIHGVFIQNPTQHTRKPAGCPKCKVDSIRKRFTTKYTKEFFLSKAKEVHGDKYDYTLVEIINWMTNVKIICIEHGEFEQTPNLHLSGRGCIICGYESASSKLRSTTEEFINKARLIHGIKYDYSLVEYIEAHWRIKIVCNKHGMFIQTPNIHLNGSGCPKCAYCR